MANHATSERSQRLLQSKMDVFLFLTQSTYAQRAGDPTICDFMVGNPHEMPLPGFVEALQRWTVPQNKDWFAYKMSEQNSQEVVAASLRERHGVDFQASDIHMTSGAFAGLSACLSAVVDPGDEVIMLLPPWFFYDTLIEAEGGVPVRVKLSPPDFDLDVEAIAAAITPRTRAIIINSPHNPTGRIYPPEALKRLASMLMAASETNGRPIYLLSDEAYSHIILDGRRYPTPTAYYPYSFLIYTYGKTLLTPGQRLGYIALPPAMPDRDQLMPAILLAQVTHGYAFPNALLQHAIADIDQLSFDIDHLQRKRDRVVEALEEHGYELRPPEGTFYLLVRSPSPDDTAFCALLAERDVFVLPGTIFETPGYFRISLTASDDMIDRALPVFADAIRQVNVESSAAG